MILQTQRLQIIPRLIRHFAPLILFWQYTTTIIRPFRRYRKSPNNYLYLQTLKIITIFTHPSVAWKLSHSPQIVLLMSEGRDWDHHLKIAFLTFLQWASMIFYLFLIFTFANTTNHHMFQFVSLGVLVITSLASVATKAYDAEQSTRLVSMIVLAVTAAIALSMVIYAIIGAIRKHAKSVHAVSFLCDSGNSCPHLKLLRGTISMSRFRWRLRDFSIVWVFSWKLPIFDQNGSILWIVLEGRDLVGLNFEFLAFSIKF